MRKILLLSLVFFGLIITLASLNSTSGATNFLQFFQSEDDKRDLLLPDMVPTKPLEIYIRTAGGKKSLRFSTTFYNQGKGPLEILGHTDKEKNIGFCKLIVWVNNRSKNIRSVRNP